MILVKLLSIAGYTFKEIQKSRIFYVTLILGVAIAIATFVATEFTYGTPQKVALDFGLGMLSLSSLGIAIFMGATLLPNEIDSRTVYMIISRPVPRWVFISGKLLGLCSVLVVNITLLSLVTLLCTHLLGGNINPLIFHAIVFNALECTLLLLIVVLFSLFANSILASVISLVVLLLGHAVNETQALQFLDFQPFLKRLLEFYHLVLPGFYKLNLKDFVIYNHNLELSYLLSSFFYGVAYSAFVYFLILAIFNRKNLD